MDHDNPKDIQVNLEENIADHNESVFSSLTGIVYIEA
jgi:hypothetical protein